MHDLDLDELDQAVNAMMDGRKRKKAPPKEADNTVSDAVSVVRTGQTPMRMPEPRPQAQIQSAPSPAPQPATSTPVSAPVAIASRPTADRPMPRVPERKRTRPGAMDIIQPVTAPKVAAPSARPARTASALQPTKPVMPEPVRPASPVPAQRPEPVRSAPAPHSRQEPTDVSDELLASLAINDDTATHKPTPAESRLFDVPADKKQPDYTKNTRDWPDPLDFHDFSDDDTQDKKSAEHQTTPEEPEVVAPQSDQVQDVPPTMATAEPTPSPFLTTKVEKRPLGAYADAVPQPQSTAEAPQWAQPPALDEDDSAVDALPQTTDARQETPVQENPATPELESAPKPIPSKGQMAHEALRTAHHQPAQAANGVDDLRQMSIPPQYQPAHHEPNDEVRNMFDVNEYHAAPQPMHHAKRSNPWITVAIVVLSVLVVVMALIAYFMMTGIDITTLW